MSTHGVKAAWGSMEPDSRIGTSRAMKNPGAPGCLQEPRQDRLRRDDLIADVLQAIRPDKSAGIVFFEVVHGAGSSLVVVNKKVSEMDRLV